MANKSAQVVIGIDFGTTRSGYAYALTGNKKIITKTNWPAQYNAYCKTLTHLLYSPNDALEAWGWEARRTLADKRNRKQAQNYKFINNFKMGLDDSHPDRNSSGEPLIKVNNDVFSVVSLIADYLRVLKEMVLTEVRGTTGGYLADDEILWCLTVPAIWSDSSKKLMRTAAKEAGLIRYSSEDSSRLLLALEPEAAVLYCLEIEKMQLRSGDRIMVLDCGGGTVDITTHELDRNKALREIIPGAGGAFGSIYVDKYFREEFLIDRLTVPVISDFHDEEPVDFLNMMADWERAKCNFDPQVNQDILLPINPKLYKILVQRYPGVLRVLANKQDGEDTSLVIDKTTMEKMFKYSLDGLINKVKEQFNALDSKGVDYIYLVGGFSTSPLLQKRVESTFGHKAKIVKPPVPGSAIVSGAVSFGLDPKIFRSRCSRLTYGYGCAQQFEEGKDPENKKFWASRMKRYSCNDRFGVMVYSGQSIDLDHVEEALITPSHEETTSLSMSFYSTQETEVRYTDEEHVSVLGSVNLNRYGDDRYSDKGWAIKFYFGQTEIKVEVEDLATGDVDETELMFSHTF